MKCNADTLLSSHHPLDIASIYCGETIMSEVEAGLFNADDLKADWGIFTLFRV